LYHLVWMGKISRRQAYRGESKRLEGGEDPLGVLRIRFDEDIKIPGETRCPMKGQRIPPDDHILNVVGVEQREQLSEVWLHFHSIVYANSPRLRHVPLAFY
jgi:hypothetical protein